MWEAIKDMQKDLREIERELPENYVRKDDITLNLLFKKLEAKEGK